MMTVATLIPALALSRLRSALPPDEGITSAHSLAELVVLMSSGAPSVVVVDPAVVNRVTGGEARGPAALEDVLRDHPYVPVVFMTSEPVASFLFAARFSGLQPTEGLVVGVDDDRMGVRHVLHEVRARSAASQLLLHLRDEIRDLREPLPALVHSVLLHPAHYRSVEDIVAEACMSRRSLNRWFAAAGLASPSRLINVSKAFMAVRLYQDFPERQSQLGHMCGLHDGIDVAAFVTKVTRRDMLALASSYIAGTLAWQLASLLRCTSLTRVAK